jgi:hypothetical protein
VAIESITGIGLPEGLTNRTCARNLGIARATGASQYGEAHKLKAPGKTKRRGHLGKLSQVLNRDRL